MSVVRIFNLCFNKFIHCQSYIPVSNFFHRLFFFFLFFFTKTQAKKEIMVNFKFIVPLTYWTLMKSTLPQISNHVLTKPRLTSRWLRKMLGLTTRHLIAVGKQKRFQFQVWQLEFPLWETPMWWSQQILRVISASFRSTSVSMPAWRFGALFFSLVSFFSCCFYFLSLTLTLTLSHFSLSLFRKQGVSKMRQFIDQWAALLCHWRELRFLELL